MPLPVLISIAGVCCGPLPLGCCCCCGLLLLLLLLRLKLLLPRAMYLLYRQTWLSSCRLQLKASSSNTQRSTCAQQQHHDD